MFRHKAGWKPALRGAQASSLLYGLHSLSIKNLLYKERWLVNFASTSPHRGNILKATQVGTEIG